MISYRALKKLIGETSLERKCRFLFGIALLVLISGSFWLYASRTLRLIETQQVIAARMLVPKLLKNRHDAFFAGTLTSSGERPAEAAPAPVGNSVDPVREAIRTDMDAFDLALNAAVREFDAPQWAFVSASGELPEDDHGFEARRRFLDESSSEEEFWVITSEDDRPRRLTYFAAVRNEDSCRTCHLSDGTTRAISKPVTFPSEGAVSEAPASTVAASPSDAGIPDSATLPGPPALTSVLPPAGAARLPLLSIARIDLSLELVDLQLNRNRAILLATGIVTAFLAMLVAYVIVRYIIVKPVLHLKDVSDEIARGNLNLRADISTGDEFEELSHAFNRMLRHMMTVNDELRTVNESLDARVDQLAQANMELFNNNRLKDDFLATISHELRTPLNSILGFSDVLQSAPNLDDRQKRYVANILSSGQSLMVQINDLLDLAKIESGKMELHLSEVRLADLLEAQVQQIMPLADRKNIELRIDQPTDPLPTLTQDRGKVTQILTNLLSNALKFTPEGGRVRVSSAVSDPETVEFSVEDNGIGIPLQEQEHIFEKFRQGSTVPGGRDHVKREYEGTGLGLSIVRELARLMGGDVSVVSEFGRGSRFNVRLPLQAPERRKLDPRPTAEGRAAPALPLVTSVDLLQPDAEPHSAPASDLQVEIHSI